MIYQEEIGRNNTGKKPVGGVVVLSTSATSMMETIKNPILFYNGNPYSVITQVGHKKSLWDYYWTSYSRGTDGAQSSQKWHNSYLDGYLSQRSKSIYDPCPFGFATPANGTYDSFNLNHGWTWGSYTVGECWVLNNIANWLNGVGRRSEDSSSIDHIGVYSWYYYGIPSGPIEGYVLVFTYDGSIVLHRNNLTRSAGHSVRCIDFASKKVFVTNMS